MRNRRVLIALTCAVIAAIGGTLAGSLTGGAAAPRVSARAAAAAAHKTVVARLAKASRRGPRGYRGYRGRQGPRGYTGPAGPQGAQAPADAIAVPVSINWFGNSYANPNGTAGPYTIPNVGTVTTECDLGAQQITFTPASSAGTRTVADVTTFQGEGTDGVSSNQEYDSYGASTPITVPLPVNGMLIGTLSVQPDSGDGGPGPSPASFIFSSDMKLNGQGGSGDFCSVGGQILQHSS
jgi:hypothetical protein